MANQFDVVPLGDVASVRSGFAFSSSDWADAGIPVVKIANVKDGTLVMDNCSFVSRKVAADAGDFNLKRADILISMTGHIGNVAMVRHSDLPAVVNQRVGLFSIPDPARLDKRFLFYSLRSKEVRERIESLGYGSVQPNVSPSLLHGVNISLPPLSEQCAIAHILGNLDDKIELNRRMNVTLEATAQALFKSWFVDFDPVRAKMEGREMDLPKGITDLLPNRFVNSEMGDIPDGWKVSEIGKEVRVVGGSTPSTKEPSFWRQGQHCWATPKDLSKQSSPVLLDTSRKITDAGLQKISSGMLPVGTVLLSSRAPIGYLAIAEVPTAVNQGFIAMRCEQRLPNSYVMHWCYLHLDYIRSIAGGSTFAEISKKAFRPIPVLVPSGGILKIYQRLVAPLYDRLVMNTKEAVTLAALRDALLPKLISGEIRVSDAEGLLESAA